MRFPLPFSARVMERPAPTTAQDAFAIPLLQSDDWITESADGELAVDVYEADACFVVQATLAGVQPNDLTLSVHRDLLTIRGRRASCAPHGTATYLTQECYWGNFSRSIVLPEAVDVARATAALANGILTITLPKLVERTEITVEAGGL